MGDIPTAVYRLFDAAGDLLYIGVARVPESRWKQHARTKSWWPQVAAKTVEWHPSRPAALVAEAVAIDSERPPHNLVIPDPSDPFHWPPPDWSERQAEGVRRARGAKEAERHAYPPCGTCGYPAPPLKPCARPDCGERIRDRRTDAIYCSQRCARTMAQRDMRTRVKAQAA